MAWLVLALDLAELMPNFDLALTAMSVRVPVRSGALRPGLNRPLFVPRRVVIVEELLVYGHSTTK
jgi:hypothetical protein